MPLFYSPQLKENSQQITVAGDEYRHIAKSRRKNISDKIKITNGKGLIANTEIKKIAKNNIDLKLLSIKEIEKI